MPDRAKPSRPRRRDDDALPELPPIGPLGDREEMAADLVPPEDEIDEAQDEGLLDDDTGASSGADRGLDPTFALDELDDTDDEEGADWDSDEERGEPGSDDLDGVDEEEDWTEGSEAAEAEGWDEDLGAEDEGERSGGDAGEEGVEERYEDADEDAVPEDLLRAPLGAIGEEPLSDDLDVTDGGGLPPLGIEREPSRVLALPRRGGVSWEWLGPEGEPIRAVGGGVACGDALYRLAGGRAERIEPDPLEGEEASSLLRIDEDHLLLGLREGGLAWLSGEDLRPRGGPWPETERAAATYLARERSGRLWAWSTGGPVLSSEDRGETWTRRVIEGSVMALGCSDRGAVAAVTPSASFESPRPLPLRIARTEDGGLSWRLGEGPLIDPWVEGAELAISEISLEGGARLCVLASEDGAMGAVASDGGPWLPIAPLEEAGHVALVREGDRVVLYAALFLEAHDRGIVLRAPWSSGAPLEAEVVLDLEDVRRRHHVAGGGDEGDQRITALEVDVLADRTELWIGSGLGVVRVIVTR